ncbi:hypothetical protein [Bacillus sp. GB_SG_008]|uniref:hypothetical protein n=1 Tax=Bacillus sp. GB_SG_008 TaxID=3454627 RepID=UPI003F857323
MNNDWIFNNYLDYLQEQTPSFFQRLSEQDELKELYLTINDIFVLCNAFDREEMQGKNYYNLIKEFKSYGSRLLLIITLNDKYLVDVILRLLVEKLYRILYGLNRPQLAESSIRKHEKRKMKERLEGLVVKQEELNDLYANYSELLHHTLPTETDLFNFRELMRADTEIINYTNEKVILIKDIFIEDCFLIAFRTVELGLATKLNLNDNLQEMTIQKLIDSELL